jgi:FlaA1/EpsC-like NDP-sugar epimerase
MLLITAFLSLILAITNSLLGLKRINWRYASPTHVVDIAISTSIALLIFSLLVVNTFKVNLPVPLIIEFGIFCFFGFVAIRYRERLITGLASRWIRWRAQTNAIGERVVVIGGGDCGQLAIWLLEKSNLSTAFSIIGIVDDDYAKQNQRINGYPVIGTVRDLPELVKQKSIGLVMFAISKISARDRETILQTVRTLPVNVIMIPDLLTVVSEYFTKQAKKAEELSHG